MNVIAVVVGLLLAPIAFDLIFRPSFRKLAIRNILRRPSEAALVVVGSLLGTAIITASFIVGDTFDASIRDFARTQLGPIDEQVQTQELARLPELQAAIERQPIRGTDGTLTIIGSPAAVASVGPNREAVPDSSVGELDLDAARRFGGDPGATGLADAGPTPSGKEAIVNKMVADDLGVESGDEIEVFLFGMSRTYEIREVLPTIGLAGYTDVLVEPGTLARLAAEAKPGAAQPPTAAVLVSNDGGVFDGAAGSRAVKRALEDRVAELDGVEVRTVKQTLLDEAKAQGDGIGQLFSSIGAFSVLVGVLLLINLFVMLGEERKTELGMLRAIGLKRNHLMRTFGLEGALYSVVAAVLGAFAGIGVGWAITAVSRSIISVDDPNIHFVLSVHRSALVLGGAIGLVISLLTVWGTSTRIAWLNVIRAIRDVPEPTSDRLSVGKLLGSLAGVAIGVLLTISGVSGSSAVPALAGPPIALLSAIALLRPLVGRRFATIGLAGLALTWSAAVFTVVPDAMRNADIAVFVVEGVVSVASAVLIVSSLDGVWGRLGNGRSLVARLAMAYPLARKVRTGILLAMFSLVIFTMTFMSVFTGIFGEQSTTFAQETAAGYDFFIDSNPANPVSVEQLMDDPDVAAAAPLLVGYPQFTVSWHPEEAFWPMSGFDERLLDRGVPSTSSRMPGLADDRAVYEAVLADPGLAIVSDFFLQESGGPPTNRLRAGDEFTVIDPVSGAKRTLTAAAVTTNDWTFNGVLVAWPVAAELLGPRGVDNRHYVAVADGADADAVAKRFTSTMLGNGADARTFLDEIEGELAEQQGFFRLMQGYLALGLAIGVAGLGVVMVRAVRERRRQVGMLRAMGFPSRTVRRAFLVEAAFIAFQGVAVGIGLGLLTSYQVLSKSATFGDQPLPFAVPWAGLAILFVLPLLAAIVATVAPAAQAAAIRPAAALRIAD